MEDEELYTFLYLNYYILHRLYRCRLLKECKRRWWCRPINKLRFNQGDFEHLFQKLKQDVDVFQIYKDE